MFVHPLQQRLIHLILRDELKVVDIPKDVEGVDLVVTEDVTRGTPVKLDICRYIFILVFWIVKDTGRRCEVGDASWLSPLLLSCLPPPCGDTS